MGARPRQVGSPARAVIDTAVVVSVLVFEASSLAWLRRTWRAGIIKPLVSKPTVTELLRVLTYPKFRLSPTEQGILQADYLPFCEPVTATVAARRLPHCRDPFDRPFVSLAFAGRADFLVTDDDDLLILAPRFPVPFVKPAELRTLLAVTE